LDDKKVTDEERQEAMRKYPAPETVPSELYPARRKTKTVDKQIVSDGSQPQKRKKKSKKNKDEQNSELALPPVPPSTDSSQGPPPPPPNLPEATLALPDINETPTTITALPPPPPFSSQQGNPTIPTGSSVDEEGDWSDDDEVPDSEFSDEDLVPSN